MAAIPHFVRFPDSVREEIAAGRLWRAREILQGRIGNQPFSPALYEQYGVVLLQMQDVVQAGKYLFLSGERRPEYEEPIRLFLERHGRKGVSALIAAFPTRVRSAPLDALPAAVRDELRRKGIAEKAASDSLARAASPVSPRTAGILATAGCLLAALFLAASIVAGAPVVIRALIDLLT